MVALCALGQGLLWVQNGPFMQDVLGVFTLHAAPARTSCFDNPLNGEARRSSQVISLTCALQSPSCLGNASSGAQYSESAVRETPCVCVHSRLYAPSMRWIQIPFALWESLVQRITYKCVKIGVIMSGCLGKYCKGTCTRRFPCRDVHPLRFGHSDAACFWHSVCTLPRT